MFSAITSFTVAANSTSFTDIGLLAGTSYYYRVKAVNGGGSSAYSGAASATTEAVASPPAAPSTVTAKYNGNPKQNFFVMIAWTDNSNNETTFIIERSSDGTTFNVVKTVLANVVSFKDTTVAAKTKYYYRVRAVNSIGSSAWSNIAVVTTK